jgi:hypothetical protein
MVSAHMRKDTPSVLDLRDSRRAAMAAALAPSVRRTTSEPCRSSEFEMLYRSFCLRVSGAVAPSALFGGKSRDSLSRYGDGFWPLRSRPHMAGMENGASLPEKSAGRHPPMLFIFYGHREPRPPVPVQ